jgi:hypothetical protein
MLSEVHMDRLVSIIETHLKKYKKVKISLGEIFNFVPADASYEEVASSIQRLMKDGILVPVKSSGYNTRQISLPNVFKVSKDILNTELKANIQAHVNRFSSEMDL